ncbi:Nif3-like dinuclear metal center hexameric protein [Candidatus Aerophobetes bacterium]|uniref:GTP cyclohydrolase 1 type 2 homolog n=1 Tax=Aerophobetes bacterium TaxID=2030807 RepID=A0A662D1M8_UNCAE|nr:MAG: Nif3-like dinuclear metal center hexameric protein [Candidatus Aerophobetes bacterium]
MKAKELASYLDKLLKIKEVRDKSLNGLVVDNEGKINKVALAVDASFDVFKRAKKVKADLLFVHHGLWWGEPIPLRGWTFKRIKFLLEENIALYVAHLPLDLHPELGNNVQLAKLLGWSIKEDFGKYNEMFVGKKVLFDPPCKLEKIEEDLKDKLKVNPITWNFGPREIGQLGYVCGGGIELLPQAIEAGLDAYLTGEPKHSYYWMAKEEGINVIFIGHYVSETLGVKAVGRHLREKFGLKTEFLNLPTGY